MIPAQSITAVIFLLIWLVLTYKPWFYPNEYVDAQRNRRIRAKKNRWRFSPHSVTSVVFKRYPQIELWSARVISLLGILICLIIILSPVF